MIANMYIIIVKWLAHFDLWNKIEARVSFSEKQKTKNNKEETEDDLDLPMLELLTIANATNQFSKKNKIGEGGFGPVYKVRIKY